MLTVRSCQGNSGRMRNDVTPEHCDSYIDIDSEPQEVLLFSTSSSDSGQESSSLCAVSYGTVAG